MANTWFRLYSETLYDPKIQILPEALRWRYVALLCLHCDEKYENSPEDEIAIALRITRDEWIETRDIFVTRALLDPKTLEINGWNKRQYISDIKDHTSAERQRRYREREKIKRNDIVTSRLPEADTDTDTDTEKKEVRDLASSDLQSLSASDAKLETEFVLTSDDPKKANSKKKKSDQVFFDWDLLSFQNISETHRRVWKEAYPLVNVEAQLNEMRAWLVSNPSQRKSNYLRFINTWLAKEQDRSGKPVNGNGRYHRQAESHETRIERMKAKGLL